MKVALVEDEELSREALKEMLLLLQPNIEIVGEAENVEEGIVMLKNLEVDLVFLDINLPDGDSFQILQQLPKTDFQLVFVTAYDEFALKAFHFSAAHYIMKPINPMMLKEALDRVQSQQSAQQAQERMEILEDALQEDNKRLALTTQEDIICVQLADIVRLEADSNYTFAYFKDGSKVVTSKPLGFYEQLLVAFDFIRVHNKHIINLKYFKRYIRGRGGMLELTTGDMITVATRRKKDLLDNLKKQGFLFFSF
ncbi:MAG: response regulator transcription factor [Aureispira sp.]|nr:response regulator transcription factor [Aureispira sp.]